MDDHMACVTLQLEEITAEAVAHQTAQILGIEHWPHHNPGPRSYWFAYLLGLRLEIYDFTYEVTYARDFCRERGIQDEGDYIPDGSPGTFYTSVELAAPNESAAADYVYCVADTLARHLSRTPGVTVLCVLDGQDLPSFVYRGGGLLEPAPHPWGRYHSELRWQPVNPA
ncbi:hypothetical protein ABIE09_000145 [Lysobacter enzymogenes]|uniref:hypothetical protein n=1 Tax=Lysobacter enzymogenes TaxID=69 RepID=UPI003396E0D9